MDSAFKPSFFSGNRQRLLAKSKADLIIITANGLTQKSGDSAFPFKQDTNFWYLTGINEPDVVLVITKNEEYLITPKLDSVREFFDGAINDNQLSKTSGVPQVIEGKAGWQKLSADLSKRSKVGILYPSPTTLKYYGYYAQPARRRLLNKLKRMNPKLKFEDLRPALAQMRMVKQQPEIKAIKKAIDITNETLNEVLAKKRLASYKYSYQIEADITAGFRNRGASGHGFDPIVASGRATTTIHYLKNDQKLKDDELILLDVGAEYSFYTADISRTISYGEPAQRQVDVFEAVKYVQSEAFKLIKPGMNYRIYEKRIEELVGEQLIKLGVIKKADTKTIRRYYPHACSHSLGLDPHDTADYKLPLPINMVLAVEPGIYIPEEGISVRIEDNVIITKAGCQVLSSSLPRTLVI